MGRFPLRLSKTLKDQGLLERYPTDLSHSVTPDNVPKGAKCLSEQVFVNSRLESEERYSTRLMGVRDVEYLDGINIPG